MEQLSVRQRPVQSIQMKHHAEQRLLSKATDVVRVGGVDLACRFLPRHVWDSPERSVFFDDPEKRNRVELEEHKHAQLSEQTYPALLRELTSILRDPPSKYTYEELAQMRRAHEELKRGRSEQYIRLVEAPSVAGDVLIVPYAESHFGVGLIRERNLQLPTALELRSDHLLNNLAVRVAAVYEDGTNTFVEFHQRQKVLNSSYAEAWDVGAAGYIHAKKYPDPYYENPVSVWKAAEDEILDELNAPDAAMPSRESYAFFGLGRNEETGQIDILGACFLSGRLQADRPPSAKVIAYDRCVLSPKDVVTFVIAKRRWIPTALMTLVLLLQARGFSRHSIENEFARCGTKLSLAAWQNS